jgi:hydroxymethylglutaryl-CoA synthase
VNHREELEALCGVAGVSVEDVLAETESRPDLYARVLDGSAEEDPYPATGAAAGALRKQPEFRALLETKMGLGGRLVRDLGNLYSAALPAWIAAGFEEAAKTGVELRGTSMVMVGYGSGDAAEAIPMTAVLGWEEAAKKIRFEESLGRAVDLTHQQYEALHDGRDVGSLDISPKDEFAILRVGETYEASFQDLGVEYYGYVKG